MFRHARLREAIRPRWKVIASASGSGSIEVSWSKNDSTASMNRATGQYLPSGLTIDADGDQAGHPAGSDRRRGRTRRGVPRRPETVPAPDGRGRARVRDDASLVPAPPADQGRSGPERADHGDRARRSPAARPEQRHGAGVPGRAGRSPRAKAFLHRRKGRPPSAQRTGGGHLRPRVPESRFRAGGSPGVDRRPRGLTRHTRFDPGTHPSYRCRGIDGRWWPGRVPRPQEVLPLSPSRLTTFLGLLAALLTAVFLTAGTAGAAIAPPWCGTPEPDAAGSLPDGSLPAHPNGSFPHIPYYAIGCTLDNIAAASGGRMTVERFGKSALGRDKFQVVINALDTKSQRRGYANWQRIRRDMLDDPERAQKILDRVGDDVKVPLFIQGGIHGNEYEGVDAAMQVIERLALTPHGTDPEVDQILDQAIIVFNPVQNPDGRVLGQRANGNGFDLNRDFLTQSQPEVQSTVALIQEWLSPELLDLHGYVSPTLIEATTKPHNPGIEYDMWLKWNQSRIDANEAAMNAQGFDVTRPINDWCADGSIPDQNPDGLCDDDTSRIGPRWAESWDDWGPFYTPMYSQLVGLNGSTVEMCNNAALNSGGNICGPGANIYEKVGRSGSRLMQYITVWSTLLFDTENRVELMKDQLEIYRS